MAKPAKVHTIESLYETTHEYGECRIWDGYMANGTPMVFHNGRMYSVRKLILELSGAIADRDYFACSCGESGCVELSHIVQLWKRDHIRKMSKNSAKTANSPARVAKISAARRKQAKLSLSDMTSIKISPKTGPKLAEEYGVSKTRISQIKRNPLLGNVWAGLM